MKTTTKLTQVGSLPAGARVLYAGLWCEVQSYCTQASTLLVSELDGARVMVPHETRVLVQPTLPGVTVCDGARSMHRDDRENRQEKLF